MATLAAKATHTAVWVDKVLAKAIGALGFTRHLPVQQTHRKRRVLSCISLRADSIFLLVTLRIVFTTNVV
jgi:hypothetical protein